MANSALRDRRILVVEDEYLIAMNLQDGLENVGSVVLGPVPSVEKAIKKIESEPHIDAAVLDVNLGGALAYPVADLLAARKIPFVFTSGYEDATASEPLFRSEKLPQTLSVSGDRGSAGRSHVALVTTQALKRLV